MKIKKVVTEYAMVLNLARRDEAIVTGQPFVERPFWYEHTELNQKYYDLFGCIGWPTEVSEKDDGRPGYVGIVGIVKGKKKPQDADFQLLAEAESKDIPSLLQHILSMRSQYGFGLHPNLLQVWLGDPDRFITTLALLNERLIEQGGDRAAILIAPPDDYYSPKSFDHYVRSLHAVILPEHIRFYFGQSEILKNRLRAFRRDDPAVFAVGGLVHSLLSRCLWMDHARENMFVVEEGING